MEHHHRQQQQQQQHQHQQQHQQQLLQHDQQQQQHQQQRVVQEAALAVVRPGTDAATRAAASQFLEQWTRTDAAWLTYCQWLQSFHNADANATTTNTAATAATNDPTAFVVVDNGINRDDSVSLQLLCLQLLQSKIRREIPYNDNHHSTRTTTHTFGTTTTSTIPTNMIDTLQAALSLFLQRTPPESAAHQPACICVAALLVRNNSTNKNTKKNEQLEQFLASICLSPTNATVAAAPTTTAATTTMITTAPPLLHLPTVQQLCILSNIPLELEAVAELSSSKVAALLAPYCTAVLECLHRVLLLLLLLLLRNDGFAATASAAAASGTKDHTTNYHENTLLLGRAAVRSLKDWIRVGRIALWQLHAVHAITTVTADTNNDQFPDSSSSSSNHNRSSSSSILLIGMAQLMLQSNNGGSAAATKDAAFMSVQTAQALQEAVSVGGGDDDERNSEACAVLLQAIVSSSKSSGLFALQNGRDCDVLLAVASLTCAIVTENIDEIVTQPSVDLLHFLLQLQTFHDNNGAGAAAAVRVAILECWLTVSEIPVQDRHEHWKAPLFQQVTAALLQTVEYKDAATDENNDGSGVVVDEDDLEEFRRMAVDVLVAAYFLLRSDYVQYLVGIICCCRMADQQPRQQQKQQQLVKIEAALFALTATAREVNARVKSKTATASIVRDRQRTVELLLQTVQHVCSTTSHVDNKVFQVGVAKFLGSYAPTWSVQCSAADILQLLAYLQKMLLAAAGFTTSSVIMDDTTTFGGSLAEESAVAIRALLVACANTLLLSADPTTMRDCLCGVMEAALLTDYDEVMAMVTEGCTRLIVQTKDAATIRHWLGDLITRPVLQRAEAALNNALIPSPPGRSASPLSEDTVADAAAAVESLCRYLRVVQVIVRFCDTGIDEQQSSSSGHPIADMMGTLSPFLEHVTHRASHFEDVFDKILEIQQQLLRTAPTVVSPYFPQTVKYVVDVFEVKLQASCMEYIACAVEAFGSTSGEAFRDLLNHVAVIVFGALQQHGPAASANLIRAFFEMNQRFILYCPSALVTCSQFPTIVACAVECLAACKDERESTRSILNFLTRLFGWRALLFSAQSSSSSGYLHSVAQQLDEQLAQHGARATRSCISTLLGGSQALWPACTECIFTIVSVAVTWPIPEDAESSVARQWIESACDSTANNAQQRDVIDAVIGLLLGFARQGPKNKPKAKMLLTDFSMIHKGEVPVETLISYSL